MKEHAKKISFDIDVPETNSEKASNIGLFEAYGFGYDFLDDYTKMIDEVTASDIISVANKYFNNIYVQSDVK